MVRNGSLCCCVFLFLRLPASQRNKIFPLVGCFGCFFFTCFSARHDKAKNFVLWHNARRLRSRRALWHFGRTYTQLDF